MRKLGDALGFMGAIPLFTGMCGIGSDSYIPVVLIGIGIVLMGISYQIYKKERA